MGKAKKGRSEAKKAAAARSMIRAALIHGANKLDAAATEAAIGQDALSYKVRDNALSISSCTSPRDLPEADKAAIFALTETNMKALYKGSAEAMPWNEEEKTQELFSLTSKMLVVRSQITGGVVAFCHYRFEEDDEDDPSEAVLYLYEIQLCSSVSRAGLGRHLMSLMELVALRAHLPKVMLTVFKQNTGAVRFYLGALKYKLDASDPSKFGNKKCTYLILSLSTLEVEQEKVDAKAKAAAEVALATAPPEPLASPDGASCPGAGSAEEPAAGPEDVKGCKAEGEVGAEGVEKEEDEEEMVEACSDVNLLVDVAAAFKAAHGRVPTMDEIKETLRKTIAAQQQHSTDEGAIPAVPVFDFSRTRKPPTAPAREVIEIDPGC